MTFISYPQLSFADAYSQPSDNTNGRRLSVVFDSTNIYTRPSDGYFSDSSETASIPVVVTIHGTTFEGATTEAFSFNESGQSVNGSLHFTTFTSVSITGNKVFSGVSYGAVEVKEQLPISIYDDGNNTPYVQTTAYGSGIFIVEDAYGATIDTGYGQYEFEYAAPFQIDLTTAPDKIYIGNSSDLQHAADGIMDEVKITSATATKTRTRLLSGSYDISVEAQSPIFSEPDAKTLVLMHLDDNTQSIIDDLRDPLDEANLSDSMLATIVSLRNDKIDFINYVNSLNITGTIVDESVDTRSLAEQLFDLVSVLNTTTNSAKYYELSGNYFPSEIIVNNNFQYAGVFSGEEYFIEKPDLINNEQGSIELWIAPLSNLLGDFKRKIYLDSVNHSVIGTNGQLLSITANLIKLPNNIVAKYINSIRLAGIAGQSITFDFAEFATLSGDGTTIVLNETLPLNNTPVIIDFIPLTASNDRLTLFKDEDSNLIFSISASGTLYQISRDISDWKKNEWHRVMITWKTNDKNNLDALNMYVDGIAEQVIKYGEGFLFNTFTFKQEHQINVNTKIIPQNIQFIGSLDRLYIGTDFSGSQSGMCRMSNLRVSFIERPPVIDARGNKVDFDFDGGSKSATPETQDSFTSYLEDFNPESKYITNFAMAQNPAAGAHDLHIIVRDNFNLVRGVDNGQVERLLRELIKIIKPAEARTRISISTNN